MMIAILTHKAEYAVDQMRREGVLDEYSVVTRRGLFWSGREFVVATREEHLQGHRLTDYRIIGRPEPELIELARTRVL